MLVRTKKEIEEVFRMLRLLDQNERERILSQGLKYAQAKPKPNYYVVSDDVSTTQDKQVNS